MLPIILSAATIKDQPRRKSVYDHHGNGWGSPAARQEKPGVNPPHRFHLRWEETPVMSSANPQVVQRSWPSNTSPPSLWTNQQRLKCWSQERLSLMFTSDIFIYFLFHLKLSFCLRSSSVSCGHSASCLQGNQIHQPQIAPPNRISLRLCAGAPSHHITLLKIADPSTVPGSHLWNRRIHLSDLVGIILFS